MEGREHGIDSRDGRMTKRGEAGSVTRPHSVVGSTQMDILLGQRDTLYSATLGKRIITKPPNIIVLPLSRKPFKMEKPFAHPQTPVLRWHLFREVFCSIGWYVSMALSAGKCDGGDGNEYDAICAVRAIFKGIDGGGIIYRKRGGRRGWWTVVAADLLFYRSIIRDRTVVGEANGFPSNSLSLCPRMLTPFSCGLKRVFPTYLPLPSAAKASAE